MNSRAFAYPEIKKGPRHGSHTAPRAFVRFPEHIKTIPKLHSSLFTLHSSLFTLHSSLSALNLRSYSLILDLFQLERRSSISTGNISSLPMIMSRVRQILLAMPREA